MKKQILATLIALLSGGAASAADLPVEYKAPVAACGVGAFQGWYVGLHGGSVSHTASRTDQDAFLNIAVPAAATYTQTGSTGFGGAQIGFNYQCRNAVLGFELDGSWVNKDRTLRILPNFDPTLISTLTNNLSKVVTGRARAGIVAADNLLVYVTGGFATAQIKTTYSVVDTFFGTVDQAQFNEWVWGWVAGFGAEWAFWDRFSLRAEGLYMQFPERDLVFTTPNFVTAANVTHADSVWMARLGVNIKFAN